MALARVCMKNSLLRTSPALLNMPRSVMAMQRFEARGPPSLSCSYSTATPSSSSSSSAGDNQLAVSKDQGSSSLSDGRRSKWGNLWRNPLSILPFRSRKNGLGALENALVQASDNLNRLLENWSPSRLLGRVKEDDKCYKLRFEVPGFGKKDLKITVEDGFLVITGQREDEEGDFDDDGDDGWLSRRYGYYNTSVLLPDDAKVEEIKAEVKDGLLYVTIPRTGEEKKNVREVEIQ